MKRILHTLHRLCILLVLLYLLGIIIYNGPFGGMASVANYLLALTWLGGLIYAFRYFKSQKHRAITVGIAALIVLVPWLFVQPSNERDWQPAFSQTGYAETNKNLITFYHIRNFDYAEDGTITERWETRTYDLNKLQGLDYFHDNFGGALVAHPILSFDFGSQGRLCLSVESRREKGESFSIFGGLFKTYEIQYIFGEESDLVRLRTNIRDEPAYLYSTNATPEQVKKILIEAIETLNDLKANPRFYNVVTANCTTSLRSQKSIEKSIPYDIRLLFNGKFDEKLYQDGIIDKKGLTFEELREKSFINPIANANHDHPDFSAIIRSELPK